MAEAGSKPIDRWLGLGSIAMGLLFYLLPKTPFVIACSLAAIFLLLLHPAWNFWWIEKSLFRRLVLLTVLAVCLVGVGYYVWPIPLVPEDHIIGEVPMPIEHSYTGLAWAAILFVFGLALSGYGLYMISRKSKAVPPGAVVPERPVVPEPPMSGPQLTMYRKTRNDFMRLEPAGRGVLEIILQSPTRMRLSEICKRLSVMGFADADKIVGHVLYSGLAEQQVDGSISPSQWAVMFGERLFREFPLA